MWHFAPGARLDPAQESDVVMNRELEMDVVAGRAGVELWFVTVKIVGVELVRATTVP
jgi:hypothetical protein